MIKGWRHRFSFVRAIRPLLRTILVYRPALSEVGEPDYETLSFVYRGLGYRFYKFERITSHYPFPDALPGNGLNASCSPILRLRRGGDQKVRRRLFQRLCRETCAK